MKMPDAIDPQLLACCGMNCAVCYKHCDSKKKCLGCQSRDDGKPEHCRSCKIKACVHDKGISHCFDCVEFPCRWIRTLDKTYTTRYETSLIHNSLTVKKLGVASFMREQREKYRCLQCGGVISLHDGICSECRSSKTGG